MRTIWLYRIRHAGSNVDSFTQDLQYVKEMSMKGDLVTCRKYFELGVDEL